MTDDTTPPVTDEDRAHTLYSGTKALLSDYGPQLETTGNLLRDATGMTPEAYDEHLVGVTHAFHDAGIDSLEAASLHSVLVNHLVKPADDATRQQWATEARRSLREQYGAAEAERRLKTVQEFVRARPALAKQLADSGAGSHPRVVAALAERADRLRMTPTKRNDR